MFNDNVKVKFECPQCDRIVPLSVRQMRAGKPSVCPECSIELNMERVKADLLDLEKRLKNPKKFIKEMMDININL